MNTMNTATASILNIAAYKFVALTDLPPYRAELRKLCQDLELRGTIMLSLEGINIFVAGEQRSVRHLLEVLRRNPLLAGGCIQIRRGHLALEQQQAHADHRHRRHHVMPQRRQCAREQLVAYAGRNPASGCRG